MNTSLVICPSGIYAHLLCQIIDAEGGMAVWCRTGATMTCIVMTTMPIPHLMRCIDSVPR